METPIVIMYWKRIYKRCDIDASALSISRARYAMPALNVRSMPLLSVSFHFDVRFLKCISSAYEAAVAANADRCLRLVMFSVISTFSTALFTIGGPKSLTIFTASLQDRLHVKCVSVKG